MNALAPRAILRPQPLTTERFESFRLWRDGTMRLIGEDDSFDAALERAKQTAVHKDKFVVRRTCLTTGAQLLSFYVVKQKATPTYVTEGHQTRRVLPLKEEHLHNLRLGAGE